MNTKFFTSALIILFIIGLPSCNCNFDGPIKEQVYVSDYQLDIRETSNNQQVSETESFRFENVKVIFQPYQTFTKIAVNNTSSMPFSLTHSLMACSPDYITVANQELISLIITSNMNYNESFPAGKNLVPIFETVDNISIQDLIENTPKSFILESTELKIIAPPSIDTSHTFNFKIELTDTTFNVKSQIINIK